MMNKWTGFVLSMALAGLLIGCSSEAEPQDGAAEAGDDATVVLADYPIDYCIVSGEKFGGEMGDPIEVEVDGRTVLLCCEMCRTDLMKDPAAYLAKLDAAAAGDTTAPESDSGHGGHEH